MPDRYLSASEAETIKRAGRELPSWDLEPAQTCDLELILNGGFYPLTGFMTRREVREVEEQECWRGQFFPRPVTLQVSTDLAASLHAGDRLALRDQEGLLIAVLDVSEIAGDRVAGACVGVEPPVHHDFKRLRYAPNELKAYFDKLGWRKVMGYVTGEPLHQKEVHESYDAAGAIEANLLLSMAVGAVRPEDPVHYARCRALAAVRDRFPVQTTDSLLLPLTPGPGVHDALLHALTLKNFGCTRYMIDERYCDERVTGLDYPALQERLSVCNEKLGIALVHNPGMVHCAARGGFVSRSRVSATDLIDEVSEAAFRERLQKGLPLPEWFSYPEVMNQVRSVFKPCAQQGFTIFFTGLSGSGKSTIANAILVKLMETGGRPITLLDGDIVRRNLSSELGFSKAHRDLNIRRIGYVASEITKHGGIAICAPIAPYGATRLAVREMIERVGGFIEVHLSTSLEECERRDRKGLYAKARAGIIKDFTGISDPYEEPESPELRIDTEGILPDEAARQVILTVEKLGYIQPGGAPGGATGPGIFVRP